MSRTARDYLKAVTGIAAFAFFSWLAFIGCYANIVRIQSTFFSVSHVHLLLMVLGVVGAVSAIALFRYPRQAGIAVSLVMMVIAGLGLYTMIERYRFEFIVFVARTIVLPLLLAVTVSIQFVFYSDRS